MSIESAEAKETKNIIQSKLGIPIEQEISSGALWAALRYEADRTYMRRKGESIGNMKLPISPNDDEPVFSTNTLASLTRKIEDLMQKEQQAESNAKQIIADVGVMDLEVPELLAAEIASVEELLASFIEDRAGKQEFANTYSLLKERAQFTTSQSAEEYKVALETVSPQRLALATEVAGEICKQSRIPVGGVNLVLEIPIVGFGNQSRFLEQTGVVLEKLEMDGDELILLLVNRPFNKPSDKTGEQIRHWARAMQEKGNNAVVVESSVPPETKGLTVKMGNIRSCGFDGFMMARDMQDLDKCIFVSTDDDNVDIAPNWLFEMKKQMQMNCAACFTPVDFQYNDGLAMFNIAEAIRRFVAKDQLQLVEDFYSNPRTKNTVADVLRLFFSGGDAGYIEPVVMSSMAMRGDVYKDIGGYPPVDEVTKTTRALFLYTLLKNYAITVTKGNIVTDSRRQRSAYLESRTSPVAAWKNPRTMFQSDDIDPIRTESVAPRNEFNWDVVAIDQYFAETFRYLGVFDGELVKRILTEVGIYPTVINTVTKSGDSFYFNYE